MFCFILCCIGRFNGFFRRATCLCFLCFVVNFSIPHSVNAGPNAQHGVAPYLPLNASPYIENEVERLAVIAGIPNLTKPYNLATLFHYLETLKTQRPRLYHHLNRLLKPYSRAAALTHARVELSYSDEEQLIANRRGLTTNDHINLSARVQWQARDWLGMYVAAEVNEHNQQATGSTLSLGTAWAQLDIGYKEHWYSPFQGSAQLISSHAETLPSVSLSNNLPLTFYRLKFNYEVFLAQMGRQPTLYQEAFSTRKHPYLAGVHFSIQPVPWLSLGASRMFQFGGGERPFDASTLVRAFYNPRAADNDASVDEESGNQIASIASRIYFDSKVPFSFAIEFAGEDVNNNKDYQLGNSAITAGVYFPYFFSEALSFTYEYSDWQNGWYTNNVYREGYTHNSLLVGHWAMQAQSDLPGSNAAAGNAQFIKGQWQTKNRRTFSFSARTAHHSLSQLKDYWDVELEYMFPTKYGNFSGFTYFGEDYFAGKFTKFGLALQWR